MHVVYDKIAIDIAGRSPENNTAYHGTHIASSTCVINKRPHQRISFITDDDAKVLKNAT